MIERTGSLGSYDDDDGIPVEVRVLVKGLKSFPVRLKISGSDIRSGAGTFHGLANGEIVRRLMVEADD